MSAAGPASVWATGAWLVLVVAYAVLSSVWTGHDPGWYAGLARPSFQPPDLAFAVVWPLNFVALFAVGVWFTRSIGDATAWRATVVLGASVVAALAWAWLFYVPHRLSAAALCLAVAAVLTWVLVGLVARSVPWAGVVLLPYAAWLSIATALSVQYARLN
ncbi:TspO/MBR family protein [Nocardioides sp.]|uniref:TspO/MBR family protein n=1 Tax=Nocardioides sp. TaxID=35761 RepID=UPI00286DB6F4|nr:TspO/MBR family protein [Nocardioides sp.]